MKKVFIGCLALVAISNAGNLDERKSKIIQIKEKRILIIQNSISCIKKASTREDMQNCRKISKANNQKLKEERALFKSQFKRKSK